MSTVKEKTPLHQHLTKEYIIMNRKQFIYNTILATTGLSMPFNSVDLGKKAKKLTILHTNDMHSHIFHLNQESTKMLGGMAKEL